MDMDVIYYKEVDSTNTKIKELAKTAKEGLVVVADRQTAGRGRRGRTWESTEEGNLYMSVLLKPELEVTKAAMLTLVMAYSVAKAIQRWKIDVQIKWPNDLIMGKKKICGILTEMEVLDCSGCWAEFRSTSIFGRVERKSHFYFCRDRKAHRPRTSVVGNYGCF